MRMVDTWTVITLHTQEHVQYLGGVGQLPETDETEGGFQTTADSNRQCSEVGVSNRSVSVLNTRLYPLPAQGSVRSWPPGIRSDILSMLFMTPGMGQLSSVSSESRLRVTDKT